LKGRLFFYLEQRFLFTKKERFWPELLGFLLVTLTNPYWWSRDFKRSNDPIWFTDVYRVDTEIILKSINWRYFYKQEN
jgi:hypothetical protein